MDNSSLQNITLMYIQEDLGLEIRERINYLNEQISNFSNLSKWYELLNKVAQDRMYLTKKEYDEVLDTMKEKKR
jgi:hypothetical protein